MRIATWNLNTWINRKNGIDNSTLWNWADDNLAADLDRRPNDRRVQFSRTSRLGTCHPPPY
jgi:hypothetical protein